MRVLLDTNIIIHGEAKTVINSSIGVLFRWLDKLKYEKCIHPGTLAEIRRHEDAQVIRAFELKLQSYNILKSISPEHPKIFEIRARFDLNDNDRFDSDILNERPR